MGQYCHLWEFAPIHYMAKFPAPAHQYLCFSRPVRKKTWRYLFYWVISKGADWWLVVYTWMSSSSHHVTVTPQQGIGLIVLISNCSDLGWKSKKYNQHAIKNSSSVNVWYLIRQLAALLSQPSYHCLLTTEIKFDFEKITNSAAMLAPATDNSSELFFTLLSIFNQDWWLDWNDLMTRQNYTF